MLSLCIMICTHEHHRSTPHNESSAAIVFMCPASPLLAADLVRRDAACSGLL